MVTGDTGVPMTFGQIQTWERVRNIPVDHAEKYHLEVPFELPARTTLTRVHAALRQLQDRHEVLRTQFETGLPFLGTQRLIEVDAADLTELCEPEAEGRPWRVDLRRGTMPWACRLTGDEKNVRHGILCMHHAIGDMTTARIVARDLYDILAGKIQRDRPPQPRELAAWQRQSDISKASDRYWLDLIARGPQSDLFSRTEVERREYWYTSVPIGRTATVQHASACALGLTSLMCSLSDMIGEPRPIVGLDFSNRWHRGRLIS